MNNEAAHPPGALAPGTRVVPYAVLTPLGAGGMGEVFRARDTRLGREVAIKILPSAFAFEPGRLRRFEQEARAVSALNHPNILTIHDLGTHEGQPYLVCELLQGRTLREALHGSPLPVATLVSWGRQVTAGLAAAHTKGIIHRDLKPENIFVTDDDRVKILDFGLAKLRRLPEGLQEGEALPASTESGMVLGTMGYMSPEQASGEKVDHRTDIFSFGAVLYEMATGRAAFPGHSLAALVAVVNEHPPRISSLHPEFPAPLERVIERCLAKKPEDRFPSAGELALALDAGSPGSAAAVAGLAGEARRRVVALGVAVAVLVGLLVVMTTRGRVETGAPGLAAHAVAVLPFAVQGGNPEEGYLADGVTDGMIVDLSQIGSLKVLAFQDTTRPLAELRRSTESRRWSRGRFADRAIVSGSRHAWWMPGAERPCGKTPS